MQEGNTCTRSVHGRSAHLDWATALLVLLLLLASVLYLQHAFQFFMDEDEGTYAYAAWRVSLGEIPYRDFLTSEMPVFLYWGGLLVRLFGRSFLVLRLSSMAATLLAAGFVYAGNRQLLGRPVALLSAGLFLIEPNVFLCARVFRAESYMLLFEAAGLYACILGEKRRQLRYMWLAGTLFGLSILSKLFGLLPLAGCLAYLLYAGWHERRSPRRVLGGVVAIVLPAVLLGGATTLIFSLITPRFFGAVFTHHTMQHAGAPLLARILRGLELLGVYAATQPVAIILAGMGAVWALRQGRTLMTLPVWLLPTALGFLLLSRDLWMRYLLYLAPALATLAALAVAQLPQVWQRLTGRPRPPHSFGSALVWTLALALSVATASDWLVADLHSVPPAETDSSELAALMQRLAAPGQVVITDYPGLNFLAGRPSTYSAAELSMVSAQSGQIRAASLIGEMEQQHVVAVLVHTGAGASHLVSMVDYSEFRRYVQTHYALLGTCECARLGWTFEVYSRREPLPLGLDPQGATSPPFNCSKGSCLDGERVRGHLSA